MAKHRNIIAFILIAAAVALIVAGVIMHQHEDVLHKAVRICMECVGIG